MELEVFLLLDFDGKIFRTLNPSFIGLEKTDTCKFVDAFLTDWKWSRPRIETKRVIRFVLKRFNVLIKESVYRNVLAGYPKFFVNYLKFNKIVPTKEFIKFIEDENFKEQNKYSTGVMKMYRIYNGLESDEVEYNFTSSKIQSRADCLVDEMIEKYPVTIARKIFKCHCDPLRINITKLLDTGEPNIYKFVMEKFPLEKVQWMKIPLWKSKNIDTLVEFLNHFKSQKIDTDTLKNFVAKPNFTPFQLLKLIPFAAKTMSMKKFATIIMNGGFEISLNGDITCENMPDETFNLPSVWPKNFLDTL